MFQLVNVYGEPFNSETFPSYEAAQVEAKKEWNAGWEVYVAPVEDKDKTGMKA